MSKRITQRELESYLWGAAILLRGLIDAGDYKQFIFPLVFLKRLSDVYDEERAQALEMYDGDEGLADLPENHRFAIPDGAHWDDIREVTTNLGPAILRAMRAIESANPDTLPGVFGDGDWGNKDLLPDSTLLELVEHFSSKTLSVENLPEDELGQGYEFLIKKFADDSGHTAQEFYTNRTLVHLMTMMLRPEPGESVYDPTCGTGGMLISTAAELRRQGKEWRNLGLYGQELNYGTSAIARMNLFLHGIRDGHIAHGDVLVNPHFKDSRGGLRTFDVVLANPPYSIKSWNRAAFTSDPYGRNIWGVPPQGRADYAFFQHIAKSLDPNSGRAAILFPHGVLFRREEAALREALVRSDLIDCVLGLGPGLFYNSPMEAVVITLRATKTPGQRGKVLFINAVNEYAREQGQSFLREHHQRRILTAYEAFSGEPGFAAVATLDDIAAKGHSLAILQYVNSAGKTDESHERPQVAEALAAWRQTAHAADDALGDRVQTWTTLNEPWCSAFLGYAGGQHAPGRREPAAAMKAAHHLLLGHGMVVEELRRRDPDLSLGITLNLTHAEPADPADEGDQDAARRIDGVHNRVFLDPLLEGRYPSDVLEDTAELDWYEGTVREGDLEKISTPIDVLGVNYYHGAAVSAHPHHDVVGAGQIHPERPTGSPFVGSEHVTFPSRHLPVTDMGWEVQPWGLRDLLLRLHKDYHLPPIHITENGAAYADTVSAEGEVEDPERIAYVDSHLRAVREAMEAGVDVRGYFVWSLFDNFEWAFGYSKRFGVVYVDYTSQQRIPKASARWYAEVATNRRLGGGA